MAIVVVAIDSDNDGMPDSYETFYGLNTSSNDAVLNYDTDSMLNIGESLINSDPFESDTDRDGFPDHSDSNVLSRAFVPLGAPF